MMRFHSGPSLPPMKEKRPLSVAELQQQRPTVSRPCRRNRLHLKACERDAHHCGRPMRAPLVRMLRYEMSGAPIEPEGVYSLTVAVKAVKDALSMTGLFQRAPHALPPHIQYCAGCCVGFCSGSTVTCTRSSHVIIPGPPHTGAALQQGQPSGISSCACENVCLHPNML